MKFLNNYFKKKENQNTGFSFVKIKFRLQQGLKFFKSFIKVYINILNCSIKRK